MIVLPDHPVWKYSHLVKGKRVCRISEIPPEALKKIQKTDAVYFQNEGIHLVTFED